MIFLNVKFYVQLIIKFLKKEMQMKCATKISEEGMIENVFEMNRIYFVKGYNANKLKIKQTGIF